MYNIILNQVVFSLNEVTIHLQIPYIYFYRLLEFWDSQIEFLKVLLVNT